MDPMTIAAIAGMAMNATKDDQPQALPLAGKNPQSEAMMRKLQESQMGGGAIESAQSALNMYSAASPLMGGSKPGVEAVGESQAPATGGPLASPMNSSEAIARRTDKLGSEGPMAIENGIKALDQVDPSTREKLAPVLLQARYKARGYDVGGV